MFIANHNFNETYNNLQNKRMSFMIISLFIIGMLFPTSIKSAINLNLQLIEGVFSGIILIFMFLISKVIKTKFLIAFLLINSILWIATLLNNAIKIDKFTGLFFIVLTLLFCLDLRAVVPSKKIVKVFDLCNMLIIISGFLIIFNNLFINQFFINNYSSFYPELVRSMLSRSKPVFTFGTHSIAGFYMFIFFYLNYNSYLILRKFKYLIISLIYLYFCFALQSNTSLIFLFIGLSIMFWGIKKKILFLIKLFIPILLILLVFRDKIKLLWMEILFTYQNTISSEGNGFVSRYSNGNQSKNMEYIISHPFSAFGFSPNNSELIVYDSGMVALGLRGTILLTLIFYITFFYFLKVNVLNKKTSIFIFFFFLIFEFAYSNLLYFRTIALLPFIIIFLNFLERYKLNDQLIKSK